MWHTVHRMARAAGRRTQLNPFFLEPDSLPADDDTLLRSLGLLPDRDTSALWTESGVHLCFLTRYQPGHQA